MDVRSVMSSGGIILWMFVQNDGIESLVPRFWYQDPGAKILVPKNGELERRSLSKIERGGAGGCTPHTYLSKVGSILHGWMQFYK